MKKTRLELLAPAKNKQCGIEAIRHGADAVYIGAGRFGARAAAGNSLEDIADLCRYAHLFGAKVYVTVNTLLYDEELPAAETLLKQIQQMGADAVLIQDLRLLDLLPEGLEVHASTQTDLRSIESVRELVKASERHGRSMFKRIVLAREMPLEEIRQVHKEFPDLEIECFVHGALCVSYSGACYASEYCFNRSANRGECAQFCRLAFDLVDAEGKTLVYSKHLLSLKDMCRIDSLEELAEAGVCSFKIEGRLKDVDYVKNVVAAYSQRLNRIIAASSSRTLGNSKSRSLEVSKSRNPEISNNRNPEISNNRYSRASFGSVSYSFRPDLKRTFNRGYTDYFLYGRKPNIENFVTPKSIGKPVGKVKDKVNYWFSVASSESFANGDGLCFIDEKRRMHGFRVNKVEGNRLFPQKMPEELKKGMTLFRNHDEAFAKLLQGNTAERKIEINMRLDIEPQKLTLKVSKVFENFQEFSRISKMSSKSSKSSISNSSIVVSRFFPEPLAIAQKPQRENIIRSLVKLGGTPYVCEMPEIISSDGQEYFIPASIISGMRQEALGFTEPRGLGTSESRGIGVSESRSLGVSDSRSLELPASFPLMQCKHCLRYALGYCPKQTCEAPLWKEPLFLKMSDGRMFLLEFDCKHCQMNVWPR